MLGHPAKVLRHTAGGILAAVMKRMYQPPVLIALWHNLFIDGADVVEGSLWALALMCEDLLAQSYGVEESFIQVACEKLLPRVIELTDVRLPGWLRKQASDLLLQFLAYGAFRREKWPAAEALQGRLLASWGSLAASPDPELVQNACQGFCSVLEQRWPVLSADHVGMILNFMLRAGRHEDDEVRREALAVWRVVSEASALHPLLEQSLPELVDVLLPNLTFGPADMLALDAGAMEEDNADQPDALEEIQPHFHKEGGFSEEKVLEASSTRLSDEWTARTAAIDALDALAGVHGTHIKQVCSRMLPKLQVQLSVASWKEQEAAIHALGVLGNNCMIAAPHLLEPMVNLLMARLSSPQALVRSTSVASLKQFVPGIICMRGPLPAVLFAILQSCSDRNKHVQAAAMETLAGILQVGPLEPFMDSVCETFLACMDTYKVRSLRQLYHCVGVAVGAAKEHMTTKGLPVLAPVFQRFVAVKPGDPTAISLFESMAAIVQQVAPFLVEAQALPRLVEKAVQVMNETAYALQIWRQSPEDFEAPDEDLMAAAVDLLAAVVEGLQAETVGLLRQNNFLCVLPLALGASSSRARQSGFWLLGSAAEHCTAQVQPLVPHLLDALVAGLQLPASLSVNWAAAWALGELCQRVKPGVLEPAIVRVAEAFVGIFQRRACVDVLPGQLEAHQQLLSAVSFTFTVLFQTSSLDQIWPRCKHRVPEDTLQHLREQHGFCG